MIFIFIIFTKISIYNIIKYKYNNHRYIMQVDDKNER